MSNRCSVGVDHEVHRATMHKRQGLVFAYVKGAGGIIVEEPLL